MGVYPDTQAVGVVEWEFPIESPLTIPTAATTAATIHRRKAAGKRTERLVCEACPGRFRQGKRTTATGDWKSAALGFALQSW